MSMTGMIMLSMHLIDNLTHDIFLKGGFIRNFKTISDKLLLHYINVANDNIINLKCIIQYKSWQQKALDKEVVLIETLKLLEDEYHRREEGLKHD